MQMTFTTTQTWKDDFFEGLKLCCYTEMSVGNYKKTRFLVIWQSVYPSNKFHNDQLYMDFMLTNP